MNRKGITREALLGLIIGIVILAILFPATVLHAKTFFWREPKCHEYGTIQPFNNIVYEINQEIPTSEALFTVKNTDCVLTAFNTGKNNKNFRVPFIPICSEKSCLCICDVTKEFEACQENSLCEQVNVGEIKFEGEKDYVQTTGGIDFFIYLKKEGNIITVSKTKPPELELTKKTGIKCEEREWVDCTYFNTLKSKARTAEIDEIVLHHTGGITFEGAYNEFLTGPEIKSIHYIIDKNGKINYLVPEDLVAFHAGNEGHNARSIGIEIVNTGYASDPYTEEQYNSIKRLLKDISERYKKITIDNEHVKAHYEISIDKFDPSPNFDWSMIGLDDHPTLAKFAYRAWCPNIEQFGYNCNDLFQTIVA